MNFYIKRFKKPFFLRNNISNDGQNNNKYTRTPAITLSATRITAIATSESAITKPAAAKAKATIVTAMTTVAVIIVKTLTNSKNNYTSGRNAEYLDDDPSDRSCEESDCDKYGSGNTLPPKQFKYTQLLWKIMETRITKRSVGV